MSCEARKSIQGRLTTLELVLTFEEGKSEFIKGVTCEYGDVPGHTKMSVLTPFLFGGRRKMESIKWNTPYTHQQHICQ